MTCACEEGDEYRVEGEGADGFLGVDAFIFLFQLIR